MKLAIGISITQLLRLAVSATAEAGLHQLEPPVGVIVKKDLSAIAAGSESVIGKKVTSSVQDTDSIHGNRTLVGEEQSNVNLNINVSNDSGICGATVNFQVEAGATAVPASGSLFPVGQTTVNVTRQDGSSYTFIVTVVDNELPVVVVQDTIFALEEDGTVTGNPFYSGSLVSRSDNCDVVGEILMTSPKAYSCILFRASPSFTVTLRQEDVNGNKSLPARYTATIIDPLGVCDTPSPSQSPSLSPSTSTPSSTPSFTPTSAPSLRPSPRSSAPSSLPSLNPSSSPTSTPSLHPSSIPSLHPSSELSGTPSLTPSSLPSLNPSTYPSVIPSFPPSSLPSSAPSPCPVQYAFRCGNEVHICSFEASPFLSPADMIELTAAPGNSSGKNDNDQTQYSYYLNATTDSSSSSTTSSRNSICQDLIDGQCAVRCSSGKRIKKFGEYQCDGSSLITECQGPRNLLRGSSE